MTSPRSIAKIHDNCWVWRISTIIHGQFDNPASGVIVAAEENEIKDMGVYNISNPDKINAISIYIPSGTSGNLFLRNLDIYSAGTNNVYVIYNNSTVATIIIDNIMSRASGNPVSNNNYGLYDVGSFSTQITNSSIHANVGTLSTVGVYNIGTNLTIVTSAIASIISKTNSFALISNSAVYGNINVEPGATVKIGNTRIGTVSNSGAIKCVGAYNNNFDALTTSCN